jgi:hypothetical protein
LLTTALSLAEGQIAGDDPKAVAVLQVQNLIPHHQGSTGGVALTLELKQVPPLALKAGFDQQFSPGELRLLLWGPRISSESD